MTTHRAAAAASRPGSPLASHPGTTSHRPACAGTDTPQEAGR